jgi:hypothetical protein
VDDQHVLALVEAIHRNALDTVHRIAANAAIVDDLGQLLQQIAVTDQPPLTGSERQPVHI